MRDLRQLGSVEALVLRVEGDFPEVARARLVEAARMAQDKARRGEIAVEDVDEEVRRRVRWLLAPSLKRVINATGVVLHTNLGRAPLEAFAALAGYQNLEYDLETGKRGKRDAHLAGVLEALLGAKAIVVNNNAAATYLVLRALAEGGEVLVSRGELIEIGDGFRIPEIMEQSGAKLREVGATNKTRLADYRAAMGGATKLMMRVHPSNFHLTGFVGKPELRELAGLAKETGVPLYEDLGSGCLVDLRAYGVAEPLVSESLEAGVDVVSFSCDKLLGGPQAGIIAGKAELVDRIRRHPMYRAFRVDKLTIQALETSLRALWAGSYERIPALRMMAAPLDVLRRRVEKMREEIGAGEVREGESVLGGGSTPDQTIPTWVLALEGNEAALEKQLRAHDPPIVARMEKGCLVIDPRAVEPEDDAEITRALRRCLRRY